MTPPPTATDSGPSVTRDNPVLLTTIWGSRTVDGRLSDWSFTVRRATIRINARGIVLIAGVCLLAFGSACGSQVEGEERGAAYADLSELADELTLGALECAHDSGVEEAYLSGGGIVGGVGDEANVVSDCFARLLEDPKYAAFSDDSAQMARGTYDGLVVIHECMVREGFSPTSSAAPTFDEWIQSGRSWSPYGDLVRDRDLSGLESAEEACEPG